MHPALAGRWHAAEEPGHAAFRQLAGLHAVGIGMRALAIRGAVWSAELALDLAEPGDLIRGLASDSTDQVIVGSMVGAARGLGLRTIAEFVEDAATAETLRSLGVDLSQGYHHGRPTPIPAA